jgi:hypothetical protein
MYNERRELVKQSTFQNISDVDYSFWQGQLILMYYLGVCTALIVQTTRLEAKKFGSFLQLAPLRHVFKEVRLVYTVS